MMVNDFDDERTLDEEEALAAGERHDAGAELSNLRREGDMPLEELLALYGYDADGERGPPPAPPPPPPPDGAPPPQPSALAGVYDDEINADRGRVLRSVSRPPSEEEDDCDYSPDEDDDWKKTIMVGSDYQAWIPDGLCGYDDAPPYENEDKLLWNPSAIDEAETERYMSDVRALTPAGLGVAAIPAGGRLRDDEQALFLLQQCGHNVEEALRRRRITAADAPQAPGLWSEEECRNFENGLKAHGKDFHQIHRHKVRTRSVGELVQFYYVWKKTERHDVFANKARLEKKKYSLHPGHADYMDRFLEEQDGAVGGRDSPGSKGATDAPPDPLAVGGREVFSELRRPSPARSGSPETDGDGGPAV